MYFLNPQITDPNGYLKKAYPNFERRILPKLSNIPNQPRIWSALLSAAGIAEKDEFVKKIKYDYFQLGPYPEINPNLISEDDYACWSPNLPFKMFVNQIIIAEYEKDADTFPSAADFMVQVILHEFVHFLDFHHDGKLQDKLTPRGKLQTFNDRGDFFEEKAYGERATLWKPIKPRK